MFKWPILIIILFTIFSCGQTTDEKTADAVLSANIQLSQGNCQAAINLLEGYGRVNDNIHYLKTLASAYSCRAGYSTVTFFLTDLALTATPAPFGGMTKYTTSTITMQNPLDSDPTFIDLQTAIDILLYAGGISSTTEPTSANRSKYFSASELNDLNSQLMFLEFAQLGKILKVYGNASAVGIKGGGISGNNCFTSYSNAPAAVQAAVLALPGACKVINSPSAQLSTSVTATLRQKRLCEGVVILNGIFDVLPQVIGSASGNLSSIGGTASTALTAAKSALTLVYPGIGTVLTTINQTICESTSTVPLADLESYYALLVENLIQ